MAEILVGCCGWGFFRPKKFFGNEWKKRFRNTLQVYASLFSLVEVNSTFYRLPKVSTAEKWFREATEINKKFTFTVKCSKVVSHKDKFETARSVKAFQSTLEITNALKSNIILVQTPASFKATKNNIQKFKKFLSKVNRKKVTIIWEPRGKSWTSDIVKNICENEDVVHCVDPLRNEPQYFSRKKVAYFRLHGFGKPSMYNYKFSNEDLQRLLRIVKSLKNVRSIYTLFNNVYMCEDALRFLKILEE